MTIDSPFCFLLSCVVSKARAKAVATPSYLITAHAHALSAHPIANCHEFRYSYVYAYQTVRSRVRQFLCKHVYLRLLLIQCHAVWIQNFLMLPDY